MIEMGRLLGTIRERIVVVEDQPMFSNGIEETLRRAYPNSNIETAHSFDKAHALECRNSAVSLFVLHLFFPEREVEPSIRKLKEDFPLTPIVIVTMLGSSHLAARMINAGADGLLEKNLSTEELIRSIARVRDGEFVIHISSRTFDRTSSPSHEQPVLTKRQGEILRLIVKKKPNKLIARELGISHHTVRNHLTILLRLLKTETRHEICQRAIELGLFERTDPNGT
jgi:two-component system, NarL family, nitrate/nitrite response regulator NarL